MFKKNGRGPAQDAPPGRVPSAGGRTPRQGGADRPVAPGRRIAAIILIAALAGYAVLTLFWQGFRALPELPPTDPVTVHEERIARLRPLLPDFGEIGYVTTVENDRIFAAEKTFTNVEFLAQYVLTQYTLAPRIVRNRPDLPLVVGNFIDGPAAPGFLEQNGLTVLRDLGDGLVLYRREGRP